MVSMNESLFALHLLLLIGISLGMLRAGREALITWIALQAILANLFVLKQMEFFGFTITCSDLFAVGGILGLNLLQEFFGPQSAKQATRICFLCMLIFALMSQMHLLYHPSPMDTAQLSYQTLLSPAPRLLIASLLTFLIVQQLDLRLFAKLRLRLSHWPLWLRNGTTLTLSQGLDTLLFSSLGLYGLVTHLSDIILMSFCIKLLIISGLTPISLLAKKYGPLPSAR